MKARIFISGLLVLLFFFISITKSFAWNATGHRLIAEIAFINLNDDAKYQALHLLRQFQIDNPKSYVRRWHDLAPWMDSLRYNGINLYDDWHYQQRAFYIDSIAKNNYQLINPNSLNFEGGRLIESLASQWSVLEEKSSSKSDKALSKAFYIHLYGDLYQPLHTTNLHYPNHPNGDIGGNRVQIIWQDKRQSLHLLWDSGLGLWPATNEFKSVKERRNWLNKTARLWLDNYQNDEIDYSVDCDIDAVLEVNDKIIFNSIYESDWLGLSEKKPIKKDSRTIFTPPRIITEQYVSYHQAWVRKRIVQAGICLAHGFNELWGKSYQ